MNEQVRALIVFCEGPHDVAFVRLVLKSSLGFSVSQMKFSEMPSPFDKYFRQTITKHASDDLSLDMAHKFFLPDSILVKDDLFVLLMNTGGKTKYEKVREFLGPLIPLVDNAKTFAERNPKYIGNLKYLFCYDADADGFDKVANVVKREFERIGDHQFVISDWVTNPDSIAARTSNNIGLYIWSDEAGSGTLEDVLLPMLERNHSSILSKARDCLESMFDWDLDNPESEIAIAEKERKAKAVITVMGQRKKYGCSMNVILEQAKLIDQSSLDSSSETLKFVGYFRKFAEVP